ncbi:uncharacterized protein LOC125307418 [Alosa alosa]|uniref:uncharacterized protein LOC125307418 n=1 Tax=Alosa alosa TaxID=278164 RepID=UPI0020154A66|nr:uncharacterized protein LOC125307418 [Alosa alosa]
MLYIVPLQEEFDLVPLACDAQEFSLMPKAECKNCFKVMPLQLLALHVKQCDVLECDSDSEPEPTQGQCPVCQMEYPVVELEQHASSCRELEINSRRAADHDGNCNMSSEAMHSFQSSEDVLDWISYQVDEGSTFPLCVRSDLFNRGMQQWQRQKKSSPKGRLKVTFLGESGIDTGALSKDVLTEMVAGIEKKLFTDSSDNKGKNPLYCLNSLDNNYCTSGLQEKLWRLAWHKVDLSPTVCVNGAIDTSALVIQTAYRCQPVMSQIWNCHSL